MDKAAQLATGINTYAVKEPRGFIKVLQVILAIFAFATTCSFGASSAFRLYCDSQKPALQKINYHYPFRLNELDVVVPQCNVTNVTTTGPGTVRQPYGNFAAPAEFYVFVGVMAFLYSLGALVLYVVFDHIYRKYDLIPLVDFVVSIVFVVLWLISSSAWAQGVADVKFYTRPTTIFNEIHECPGYSSFAGPKLAKCEAAGEGNFATLNVSLIFGFLNCAVWAGNLWFLWKETSWFKVRSKPTADQQPPELAQQQEPQRDYPQQYQI